MRRFRIAMPLAALVGLALAATPVQALFHQWDFTEFFSNADGTVQFIELRTTAASETVATAGQLRSLSTGKTFTFPSNLVGPTTNKSLLVATTGFGALTGGVAPDFTLPSNFFNPAGDTVSLVVSPFGTVDSKTFTSVPTDGVTSINYPPLGGTQLTNSPTNYAGASGSVDLAPPATTGDYNGNLTVDAADYTVWRDTFGQAAAPFGSGADGNADGTIDPGDYDFWKGNFGDVIGGAGSGGTAAAAIVPEPTVLALSISGILALILAAIRARPVRVRL